MTVYFHVAQSSLLLQMQSHLRAAISYPNAQDHKFLRQMFQGVHPEYQQIQSQDRQSRFDNCPMLKLLQRKLLHSLPL